MSYLEELLPEFRKGIKIRRSNWPEGHCVKLDTSKKFTVDNNGKIYTIYAEELLADNWEFYQEPIDWQYIIDNKCLCWFWDDCEKYSIEYGFLGFLAYVQPSNNTDRFEELSGKIWKNCHPVRRDEITFYEDREE